MLNGDSKNRFFPTWSDAHGNGVPIVCQWWHHHDQISFKNLDKRARGQELPNPLKFKCLIIGKDVCSNKKGQRFSYILIDEGKKIARKMGLGVYGAYNQTQKRDHLRGEWWIPYLPHCQCRSVFPEIIILYLAVWYLVLKGIRAWVLQNYMLRWMESIYIYWKLKKT